MKLQKLLLAVAIATSIPSSFAWSAPTREVAERQDAQRAALQRLESSNWVQDGKTDAPRIIYVITDPNCIWCHRFWEAARPWVNAGDVQIRHVLVGVIKKTSAGKAAAILDAPNPSIALEANELSMKDGGISEATVISNSAKIALADNLRLMHQFGFRGTPAILYTDSNGDLIGLAGYPRDQLEAVMGSSAPKK